MTSEKTEFIACKICGNPVKPVKDDFSPGFFPLICDECDEKRKLKEAQEKIDREIREARNTKLEILGSYYFQKFTFDQFVPQDGQQQNVLLALRHFDPKTQNIYIFGSCGTGKTHLAAAALREHLPSRMPFWEGQKKPFKFVTLGQFNRWLRAQKPEMEESRLWHLIQQSPMVLDDLAAGKTSEFTFDMLLQFLDGRIRTNTNGLIITSNLGLDDLAKKAGDDRIASRLGSLCRVYELRGKDMRITA